MDAGADLPVGRVPLRPAPLRARPALSGGEHIPVEDRTRDRRSATLESMCHPRENKTRCSFVVLVSAVGLERASFGGTHRWCLSPTEVCLRFERSNYGRRGVCPLSATTTATMASVLLVGSLSLTWGQASGSASGSELAGTIDRVQTTDGSGPETRRCAMMGPASPLLLVPLPTRRASERSGDLSTSANLA